MRTNLRTVPSSLGAALVFLATGCTYHPNIPSGAIACTTRPAGCPSGMTCVPLDTDPTVLVCQSMQGGGGRDGGEDVAPGSGGATGGRGGEGAERHGPAP